MPRRSQAELIFDHALKFVQPLRTTDGHAWAVIPTGPFKHRGDLIASSDFREYLATHFHHEHEVFPSRPALTHAIRMLAAHATQTNAPAIETFTRIGYRGDPRRPDAILIDLANPAHDVLEITTEGRRIRPNENCHFLQSADTRPLPHPIDSPLTPIEHLRDILPLPEPALQAAQDWLLAALRPAGPYPTLIITGPERSGKTTLARTLRDIIDPAAALPPIPRTARQLHNHALRHRVLVLDHVTSLRKEISESVSRLTTGTAIAVPTRNVIDDPKPIPIARPVVITAPAGHRSFPANAIHIRLEAIAQENLRDEASIQQQLEKSAPALLGALCTALAGQAGSLRPIVNRPAEITHEAAKIALSASGAGVHAFDGSPDPTPAPHAYARLIPRMAPTSPIHPSRVIIKMSNDESGRKPTFLLLQIAATDVQGSNRQSNIGNCRARRHTGRDRGCRRRTSGRRTCAPRPYLY